MHAATYPARGRCEMQALVDHNRGIDTTKERLERDMWSIIHSNGGETTLRQFNQKPNKEIKMKKQAMRILAVLAVLGSLALSACSTMKSSGTHKMGPPHQSSTMSDSIMPGHARR